MILNSSQLNKANEGSSFDIHHDEFIGSSYMSYHKQKKQKTSKLEKISRNVNYDLVTPVEDMQFVEIAYLQLDIGHGLLINVLMHIQQKMQTNTKIENREQLLNASPVVRGEEC